jgi:hypothetical protein
MRAISKGVWILVTFFILVFTGAFYNNPHFPQLVIVGEASVATWMSGVLLVVSATLCLTMGMQLKDTCWFLMTLFFFILALDERFMFHEQLKEQLIFNFKFKGPSKILNELPVMLGAVTGLFAVKLLWMRFQATSKMLLLAALTLGMVSVVMDIFSLGVLLEDSSKVLAELCICCALILKIND